MDKQFRNYCRIWSSDVAQISDENERIAYFQKHLPELLIDHGTVRSILEHMARGKAWPDLRRSGLFSHEVLLYLDSGRRFSIRLYFHRPHAHTEIHDHTSWGVSGTPYGRLSVIHYTCKGTIQDGRAQIHQQHHHILRPGEVVLTQPWNEGIHQTGSVDDTLNVMISVYGRPGRRLYVQIFNPDSSTVERIYPARMLRRMLAKEALDTF